MRTYHRWVKIDGTNIFYREAGRRGAPTIILLHGYPSSSRMWTPIIGRIAERYHVLAPDYPGFGRSDAPSPVRYDYSFANLARSMLKFLTVLEVDQCALFMQDYGGPIGFRIALSSSAMVRAIIVQNANAYLDGLGPKWTNIARFWSDPGSHLEELLRFMSLEGARERHLGRSPLPNRYDPDSWSDEFVMLSRPGQRAVQGSLLFDYRHNVASYPDWQAWLRQRQPPTLVLWGRYDPSFIVPGALAYARDVPEAEIHLLDAGHFALDEQPELVGRLVLEFLDRQLGHHA